MSVKAIGTYKFPSRDREEIFGDNIITYFSWEQHLLFAAPFLLFTPRDVTFGQLIEDRVKPLLVSDPQAGEIDWNGVEWLNGDKPFAPDFAATLEANGIGHKDHIRMITLFPSALFPKP
ncbi:phenol hydroxylase subunit P4 [Sphingopyxis sp. 550A]